MLVANYWIRFLAWQDNDGAGLFAELASSTKLGCASLFQFATGKSRSTVITVNLVYQLTQLDRKNPITRLNGPEC
jgi:hypothetical protein